VKGKVILRSENKGWKAEVDDAAAVTAETKTECDEQLVLLY